jgi:hypothetical protein
MKELTLLVIFSLASAAWAAGLESIPFGFYEELKNSEHEKCNVDVKNMLDGVKNLDKWALESWFLFQYAYYKLIVLI